MTVATTTNKAIATGNGITTSFPFTFGTLPSGDLVVTLFDLDDVEIPQVENVNYTVSGKGDEAGGAVLFSVAPASGYTVLIQRILPITQPTDYKNQGSFYPRTHERSFDRTAMIDQQLDEENERTIKISAHLQGVSTELPAPEPVTVLGWNDTADAIKNYPLSELATSIAYGSKVFQTFVGDGVSVDFALISDPASLGNLDVSIDGVTQVNGADFAYATTTLSFAVAPANGAVILVRYDEALAIGEADASAVHFIQSGAGAVERSSQDKMRETVSVLDFIPVAQHAAIKARTSTFDCTSYIQSAIDIVAAAGGGELIFPTGLYNITATLDLPYNDVVLRGAGCGHYSADGIVVTRNSAATRISWTGAVPATGTPMVDFRTPSTARERARSGIRDIMLDGNMIAKVGVALTSYGHAQIYDTHVYACTEDGFLFRTASYNLLGGAGASQFNVLTHVAVTGFGGSGAYLTNPCHGIRFSGAKFGTGGLNAAQSGDSSHNTVYSPRFDLAKGSSLIFEGVGQNVVYAPQGGAWAGATLGYSIIFGSTDQDSNWLPAAGVTNPKASIARYNAVFWCEHDVVARASQNTNGGASFGNMVWGASRGNGAPEPVVENPTNNTVRAELVYQTIGRSNAGTESRSALGGNVELTDYNNLSTVGPALFLHKVSDVGEAGDSLGKIQWLMTNDAGTTGVPAGRWEAIVSSAVDGSETVSHSFYPQYGGNDEAQLCIRFMHGAIMPDGNLPNLAFQGFGTMNVAASYWIDNLQVVGPRQTGWSVMTGTANKGTTYNTATVTLVQLAERVKALQDALTQSIGHGLIGA